VGMTGVAWSYEEPSAAARVLRDFRKANEKLKVKAGLLEGEVLTLKLKVKAGLLEGEVLTSKAVEEQLATLPNKDEARAQLLATMMAPAQQLVMLLNAPAQNFVGVLAAKERKESGG